MATESKATALREKSTQELKDELIALRKEEFDLRMKRGTGQSINTAQFKKIRRDVARIKTIQNENSSSVLVTKEATKKEETKEAAA